MTVAELHLGVLSADDPQVRARRLATLVRVERSLEPLPVTADVARRYAELATALRAEGRRAPIIDALIAATAIAHGLVLYTLDEDFEFFPELEQMLLAASG